MYVPLSTVSLLTVVYLCVCMTSKLSEELRSCTHKNRLQLIRKSLKIFSEEFVYVWRNRVKFPELALTANLRLCISRASL